MNWNNEKLLPMYYNAFNEDDYTPRQLLDMKKFCKTQNNITCVYCGGTYKSAFGCFMIDKEFKLCCQLCYIITNYTKKYSKMLQVIKSDMSQLEIIRKTVGFVENNRRFPNVYDIDKNIKIPNCEINQFFAQNGKDNCLRLFYTNEIDILGNICKSVDSSVDFADLIKERTVIYTNTHHDRNKTLQMIERWKQGVHEMNRLKSVINEINYDKKY